MIKNNRRYFHAYLIVMSRREKSSIRCRRFCSALSSAQNGPTRALAPIPSSWNFCYWESVCSISKDSNTYYTDLMPYLLSNKDFTEKAIIHDSCATCHSRPLETSVVVARSNGHYILGRSRNECSLFHTGSRLSLI